MTQPSDDGKAVKARWALEALRNGVPNRYAVEMLGCNQPAAVARFENLLTQAADPERPPYGALGMLVEGDFGTGKSHFLTHLERMALADGFVCSKVSISKETPLYDLRKIFIAATGSGRIPHRSGRLMEELWQQMDVYSPKYSDFYHWANQPESGLNGIFPASLVVRERLDNVEINSKIEAFWSGERILKSDVTQGLNGIRQRANFAFSMPKEAERPPQHLRFALELIKAAGYKGWVILIDEIELVGSYSLLQRGRSYAELARWMGQMAGNAYPGLVTVGTVTDDFETRVISDGKMDRDTVGPRLEIRYGDLVEPARNGMRLLSGGALPLAAPTDDDVQDTLEKIRRIYSDAYAWDAPAAADTGRGAGYLGRMRYRVRAAINEWDLLRLYPDYRPETESEEFRHSYEENPDLEAESRDDDSAMHGDD